MLLMSAKEKEAPLSWKTLHELFAACFASITRHTEISNRLEAIGLEDVKFEEDDDYMELERLTQRIDQLAPMARSKYRDDEAKARLLTRAITGTKWD